MKELSIEEKAKRYDEAIKVARQYYNDKVMPIGTNFKLEKIFPELKESNDERIRKALIDGFKRYNDGSLFNGCLVREILPWLEKQGEQKATIEIKTPEESLDIDSETYNKIVDECIYGEQKTPWLKELKEKFDSMSKEELQQLWDKYKPPFEPTNEVLENPAWSEEDKKMSRFVGNAITADGASEYLGSKGIQAIDVQVWLEKLKDRVQQPKQEWNEEDEINRDLLYNALNQVYDMEHNKDLSNWINKRILLCSQQQWKPSDAQMASITCAVRKMKESACYDSELVSLLNDLKKLKG